MKRIPILAGVVAAVALSSCSPNPGGDPQSATPIPSNFGATMSCGNGNQTSNTIDASGNGTQVCDWPCILATVPGSVTPSNPGGTQQEGHYTLTLTYTSGAISGETATLVACGS
jgi:hypothetical protein